MSSYFRNVKEAFGTLSQGLRLTFSYLLDARQSRTPIGIEDEHYFDVDKGIVTLQYPHESLPVPDNARYRLHNEVDDCIVCDKCAKVCPVDCIDIEAIKAPESFGVTSDGTAKRIHAAKFDIDMAKCCFCGLCTTVCPTECLTMTKVYDFSEFDVNDHVYSFSNMSLTEIAQKRKELAEFEAKKAASKAVSVKEQSTGVTTTARPKPAMKPKPVAGKPTMKPKVAGKPVMKPKANPEATDPSQQEGSSAASSSKPRPVMKKPVLKPKVASESGEEKSSAKPRPVMKPKTATEGEVDQEQVPKKPRPVMKPKMETKPAAEQSSAPEEEQPKPKPKFRPRPVMKRKPKDEDGDQ